MVSSWTFLPDICIQSRQLNTWISSRTCKKGLKLHIEQDVKNSKVFVVHRPCISPRHATKCTDLLFLLIPKPVCQNGYTHMFILQVMHISSISSYKLCIFVCYTAAHMPLDESAVSSLPVTLVWALCFKKTLTHGKNIFKNLCPNKSDRRSTRDGT